MKKVTKKIEIEKLAAFNRVKSKLYNLLSFKQRSRYEILQHAKKYIIAEKALSSESEKTLTEFVTIMEDMGFIDDQKYAAQYVQEKLNSPKPTSKFKIRQFLYKKQIAKSIVEVALNKISDEDQLKNAILDTTKKLRTLQNSNRSDNSHNQARIIKSKLIKYLINKGYDFRIANSAVDRVHDVK